MPIYEYQCQKCGSKLELLQKMGENTEDLKCSSCGSHEMKKIISAHLVGKSSKSSGTIPSCGSSGCDTPGGCCSGGHCGLH